MTKKEMFEANYMAIEELFLSYREKRNPNPNILKKYVGYGGIKEILANPSELTSHKKDVESLFYLIESFFNNKERSNRMIASLRQSVLTSYYTNSKLLDGINSTLKLLVNDKYNNNPSGFKILDPSTGLGAYLESLSKTFPKAEFVAIEKEGLAGTLVSKIYPNVMVHKDGYETFAKVNNTKFDLITSNIPFGDYRVYDPDLLKNSPINSEFYANSMQKIHEYYFARSIQNLAPNGVIAFITSTGIMDKSNESFRKGLIQECSLVGAIRLPKETFKDAGTSVDSDLIILQKREKAIDFARFSVDELSFIKTKPIEFDGVKDSINDFYLKNPLYILGDKTKTFLHNRPKIQFTNENILDESGINRIKSILTTQILSYLDLNKTKFKKIASLQPNETTNKDLSLDLFAEIASINQLPQVPTIDRNILENFGLDKGSLFPYEGVLYKVGDNYNLELLSDQILLKTNKKNIDFWTKYHDLRTAYHNFRIANEDTFLTSQKALNTTYDVFLSQYGTLNSNNHILKHDYGYFKILALEKEVDSKIEKSDIFFKNPYLVEKVTFDSLETAINYSLVKKGQIDLTLISELLNRPENDILNEGLKNNLLFYDVHTENITEWTNNSIENLKTKIVSKEEFLSGNVLLKQNYYDLYGSLLFDDHDIYYSHKRLLEDVVPQYLSLDLISPSIGELWIPKTIFEDFAQHLFKSEVNLNYLESVGRWNVNILELYSSNTRLNWTVHCKNGRTLRADALLENALQMSYPKITYTNSDGYTVIDKEATDLAREKIDELNKLFKDWILTHKDKDILEKKYNQLYNSEIKRKFNGSHLTFPGLNQNIFIPHSHQKDAVWKFINDLGGIGDHIVGSGKTLVMAMSCMEMKRMKLVSKPMITALPANAAEIAKDFIRAYPEAKVLCPKDSDFTPGKRKEFLWKVANNDWDVVILTHEQLGKIPLPDERVVKQIEEEIDLLDQNLAELRSKKGSTTAMQRKGLEKRKANLEAKLKEKANMKKDEDVPSFDKLGVDFLFVDESQQFKNLSYTTIHGDVSGLNPPEGSAKAFNLLMICRLLQEKHNGDKGIAFMSGTTLSNSIVELYSLFKYLAPQKMQKLGILNFDSWARTFAEISVDFEISVTGEVIQKKRIRSFVKVPELAKIYSNLAHVVNDQNLKLDKPELDRVLVEVKQADFQSSVNEEIIKCVKSKNWSNLGYNYDPEIAKRSSMLIATGIATKAAVDVRLLDPEMTIEDGSKIPDMISNAIQLYNESSPHKGTQIIFCDLGVPKSSSNDSFNLYESIKQELIKNGVKAEEIAFIHDYKSKPKRSELFKRVNDGVVRFLIGSTTKLGVGVNVQKRLIALHHLDLPWRPSDLDQRDGRGVRQGNMLCKTLYNNKIKSFIYCTEKSLDAYRYYLIDLKAKFINQIKEGTISQRRIDEGDLDTDGSMSPAAFIAKLSGKEEVLKKNKLEKELRDLNTKKDRINSEVNKLKKIIENNPLMAETIKKRIAKKQIDLQLIQNSVSEAKNGKLIFTANLSNNNVCYDTNKLGEHIINESQKIINALNENLIDNIENYKVVAEIGTLKIGIKPKDFDKDFPTVTLFDLAKEKKAPKIELRCWNSEHEYPIYYGYGAGVVNMESAGTTGRAFIDAIRSQIKNISAEENEINQLINDVAIAEKKLPELLKINFDNEIQRLEAEIKVLEKILENELTEKNEEKGEKEELHLSGETTVLTKEPGVIENPTIDNTKSMENIQTNTSPDGSVSKESNTIDSENSVEKDSSDSIKNNFKEILDSEFGKNHIIIANIPKHNFNPSKNGDNNIGQGM